MKIQIDKSALVSTVSMVLRAISSKTNMQILEGIYMEAKDGQLILRATERIGRRDFGRTRKALRPDL